MDAGRKVELDLAPQALLVDPPVVVERRQQDRKDALHDSISHLLASPDPVLLDELPDYGVVLDVVERMVELGPAVLSTYL